MRDRSFADRLLQIKVKYGYAQEDPSSKGIMKHQYGRCSTPTMYDRNKLQQFEYTTQKNKLNPEYEQKNPPTIESQRRKQMPEEKSFYRYHQGQSPIIDLTEISSSPIKRFENTIGCPNSSRNSISPQKFVKIQSYSPMMKDNSYQSRQIKNVSRNIPHLSNFKAAKENELPSENSFYQSFQTPRKDQIKFKECQINPHEQSFGGKSSQKRSILDQCNFNIQSIDKIQDRIANALRKNK